MKQVFTECCLALMKICFGSRFSIVVIQLKQVPNSIYLKKLKWKMLMKQNNQITYKQKITYWYINIQGYAWQPY